MQPLLIGPYEVGVQQNLKPFMIPEDAFQNLMNAYVFRGRIERKDGYYSLGRLQIAARAVNTAAGTYTLTSGAFSGTEYTNANILADAGAIYTAVPLVSLQAAYPNATIVPGSLKITINAVNYTDSNGKILVGATQVGTINYATGDLLITLAGGPFAVTTTFSIYPSLPVMGISKYEISAGSSFNTNIFETIFFDTRYAYAFGGGTFAELPSTLKTQWSSSDTNFFWSTNYQVDAAGKNLFWVTNNKPGLHAFAVTLFANAVGTTVDVTATGNTFKVNDVVYFLNLAGAGAANNTLFGTVTVAGDPTFTISNSVGYFATGIVTGLAVTQDENISGDGIRYYNGTRWFNYNPLTNTKNAVCGCLMMIPYKSRLLLFSTIEGNTTNASNMNYYRQRVRWSLDGTLSGIGSPIAGGVTYGWRDDIAGLGGYVDAPTSEAIISAGFIKDHIVVYFERSTWLLLYTGNQVLPFVWQRINAELGSESTFSSVIEGDNLIDFGNVGIHACNGVQAERIDQAIPDEVYSIHQLDGSGADDGPKRTVGVRDFVNESLYFTYSSKQLNISDQNKVAYPNRILVYNYRNKTFSFFDDNATFLGYYQPLSTDNWNSITWTWDQWTAPWNSGLISQAIPNIAFGNQQGYVEVIDHDIISQDTSRFINAFAAGSTPGTVNITSPQHGLFVGQYVRIVNCLGYTALNNHSYQVASVISSDVFSVYTGALPPTGYTGSGELVVLSNIKIQTKVFTPFWSKGKRYILKYMDVLFDKTTAGELDVDIFVDFNDDVSLSMTKSLCLTGTTRISTAPEFVDQPYYSLQKNAEQIWKRFYTYATGETFQIQFTMNNLEMITPVIQQCDVVIHAMIFHFEECGEFY